MAVFNPNIDYVGHQRLRARGLEGVTQAKLQTKLRAEAEARRAAAAAASRKKKSSFGRKIIGAVARGAAAYYTGGASEASGVGSMIDQQIQGGADYERNEYGDLVGAVSVMGGMMTAKTANAASTRLNAQSARDDQMQERMDKISPEAGLAYAEKREAKDAKNREVFNEYKGGMMNMGKDIDGLDLSSTIMDYSGIKPADKIKTTPADIVDPTATRGLGTTTDMKQQPIDPLAKPDFFKDEEGAGAGAYGEGISSVQAAPAVTAAPPVQLNVSQGALNRSPDQQSEIKYEDRTSGVI
jgi:hypothetical protein